MIDVTKRQCIFVGCTSKPSYNLEGEKKPLYCSKHALADMVDIMTKKCLFEGCKVGANFNFEGFTVGLYCSTHKDEGMVDIHIKYCQEEECEEHAYYNYVGKTAVIYCANHKKDGMINVRTKKCISDGCLRTAVCNVKGLTERLYCLSHKTPDMVNLSQVPCKFEGGCDLRPHYNIPGATTGIYCRKHKEEGMIDVTCDRCEEEGCDKVPGYNFPGEKKKLYCATHKKATMVAVGFKVCNGKDDTGQACINRARYGPLFKSVIHCLDHRLINECEKNNPKCQQKGCKEKPLWSDIGNYPKRCENHKLDNDVNVIEMPCSSCGITDIINAETKLCNTCDAYPRVHKAKENFVGVALKNAGFVFESADKIVAGGCSRYRPDFIIDYTLFKVIVEVDENQHQGYAPECELNRMKQIFQDFGGTPVLFIRYNPDSYKNICGDKQVSNDNRVTKLVAYLNTLKNHKEWLIPLSVCYMFYDGYDNTNVISQMDPMISS